MSEWFWPVVVTAVIVVGGIWDIRRKYGRAEGGEVTPLDDLLGDDTLAMVAEDRPAAEMWDSFEEADVHGIEVDDTAAEADIAPYSVIAANGPAVVAQGRALVADLDAWMKHTDLEAWLGERGWL